MSITVTRENAHEHIAAVRQHMLTHGPSIGHIDERPLASDTDWWEYTNDQHNACMVMVLRNHPLTVEEPVLQNTPEESNVIVEVPTREVTLERELAEARAEADRFRVEATRTFSRYDERLLPMFINAARIATAADFCNEYDRIAEAVGAPTRDELREQGHLTRTARFQVPITIHTTVWLDAETSDDEGDEPSEGEDDWIADHEDDILELIQGGLTDVVISAHPSESVRVYEFTD